MASKPPLTDSLVAAAWIGDQAVAEPGCRWVHYRGSFYRSGGGIYEKMEDLAVEHLIREYAEATFPGGVARAKYDLIAKAAKVACSGSASPALRTRRSGQRAAGRTGTSWW